VLLAIFDLHRKFLFQNEEGFCLPRRQVVDLKSAQAPAYQEFFGQALALRRNVRLRAGVDRNVSSRPDGCARPFRGSG
jgi:hypothetical protein